MRWADQSNPLDTSGCADLFDAGSSALRELHRACRVAAQRGDVADVAGHLDAAIQALTMARKTLPVPPARRFPQLLWR